jgi:DNA helicase-2/ATP-dependent DNA helicase PcrA
MNKKKRNLLLIKFKIKYENPDFKNYDFCVLYRTNAQSRAIEEVFIHRSISYILIGGTRFYERKEIKDVLSYLKFWQILKIKFFKKN